MISSAASIISKKAAEMLDTLVLDVKVGKGAFLKDETMARELASRMVRILNWSVTYILPLLFVSSILTLIHQGNILFGRLLWHAKRRG